MGSLSAEAVILTEAGELAGWSVIPTGADIKGAALESLHQALKQANLEPEDVQQLVATGYGRVSVEEAHKAVTEITCHARGINHLLPEVRTLIDIGGQDSKVIRVGPRGMVEDFVMNDKCAAGTGRFLEVMARALEVDLEGMAARARQARETVTLSSTCAVFAESEVVSLLAAGYPREQIIRGLHEAVAERTMTLAQRVGIEAPLAISGGVAKNDGVVQCLEESLGESLAVPWEPQVVGALGAALLAGDRLAQGAS